MKYLILLILTAASIVTAHPDCQVVVGYGHVYFRGSYVNHSRHYYGYAPRHCGYYPRAVYRPHFRPIVVRHPEVRIYDSYYDCRGTVEVLPPGHPAYELPPPQHPPLRQRCR